MRPSKYQLAIYDEIRDGTCSILINAVAGSGKTTTIVKAIEMIPQAKSIFFGAFNKSIAVELQGRLPPHVHCRTLNSLGFSMLFRPGKPRIQVNSNKIKLLISSIPSNKITAIYGDELIKIISICKAYGLIPNNSPKQGLIPDEFDCWQMFMDRFSITIDPCDKGNFIDMARRILSMNNLTLDIIDFDDQLYLPFVLNRRSHRFDFVFIDEAQDMSPIQRQIIKSILAENGRLVAVGDNYQAIYGFRGADPSSMKEIAEEFNAKQLPLSISYRCAKNVVTYAQTVMPYIEANEDAIEGSIQCLPIYHDKWFEKGDLIICRNSEPLLMLYFSLFSRGLSIRILGKEIGEDLIRLIDKLKALEILGPQGLVQKVYDYRQRVRDIYYGKDDIFLESLNDKCDALLCLAFSSKAKTIEMLKTSIRGIFSDKKHADITLCTIHKAKGLEADRVFILDPDLIPSRHARKEWELLQEKNLMYVAITRAKKELFFIRLIDFNANEVLKISNG